MNLPAMLAPLRSSTSLAQDAAALRSRFADDGYLYFPGLLDPAALARLRSEILATVARFGWTAEGTDPQEGIPSQPTRWHGMEAADAFRESPTGWRQGYIAIQQLESFHRQANDAVMLAVMARLFGDNDVIAHGQRIARVIWPAHGTVTLAHQDYTHIQGTPDVITAWVPLADCPQVMGGLKLLPGSHRTGVRKMLHVEGEGLGTGSMRSDVADDDPGWRTVDWQLGDVVVFHSLTVHAGQPNLSGRLRLSMDFRYQLASDPIAAASLSPHNYPYVPDWETLLANTRWSSYEPVARVRSTEGYRLANFIRPVTLETWHEQLSPVPPSRFA